MGGCPPGARAFVDTSDLVQDALLHTVRRMAGFEPASSLAFGAYLLRAVDYRV